MPVVAGVALLNQRRHLRPISLKRSQPFVFPSAAFRSDGSGAEPSRFKKEKREQTMTMRTDSRGSRRRIIRRTSLALLLGLGLTWGLAAATNGTTPGEGDSTITLSASTESSARATSAQTFRIDATHSAVLFRVKHAGVSYFHGRFNKVSGTFVLDKNDPGASSFTVSVKADSADTADARRDRHIKSQDFLNAKQFPTIDFKSTNVVADGPNAFEVSGDFTMHGVTRPIKAKVTLIGEAHVNSRFGYRAGVEVRFSLKRSDFGMTTYIKEGMLGDEIGFTVALEGARQ